MGENYCKQLKRKQLIKQIYYHLIEVRLAWQEYQKLSNRDDSDVMKADNLETIADILNAIEFKMRSENM